jgi:mRNA-degrading endonuclease RelE of RelBE toxin-antitoxin system
MNIVLEIEAKKDLKSIETAIRSEIVERIENLEQNPTPENSYVIKLLDGDEVQCLKLQEEDRNSKLNHRVTYDIIGNEQIRVYGIFPREPGYERIKKETRDRK